MEHAEAQGERERAAYVFDFREGHSPDVPDDGWADQEARLKFLRSFGWERWETARSAAGLGDPEDSGDSEDFGDPEDFCDPDIRTAAELEVAGRAVLVKEVGMPEEEFRLAFEMLGDLLTAGGWTFAGGGYVEFCGNHNDNWLVVVLQR